MDQTRANKPLSDVTVIDFGQIFQGPYATLLMAKAGADVIKIEPPRGEPLRRRADPGKSATLPFAMLNQNKRAITLNLKEPRGRELLFRMVERADVLLENFSPGMMDRLGVGWSRLHEINPRLIYASGTGFGLSGPDRDNLAMDMTIQAVSGIMSVTGFPDGPPVKAGPTLVDFMGGIHLYAGVLPHSTSATAAVSAASSRWRCRRPSIRPSPAASNTTTAPARSRRAPATARPASTVRPTTSFPTNDGHVAIHIVIEAHCQNLLKAMGREESARRPAFCHQRRPRRAHGRDRRAGRGMDPDPRQDGDLRHRQGIPHPLRAGAQGDEVMNDPHMHERGMLERIEHPELGPIVVPTSPLRLHGTDKVETRPSPTLGQHNDEIYGGWLGLSAGEIEELRQGGVI